MSYLVLARKYRPDSFATVTGQEQVTRTLANSIRRQQVAHAYLFAGPRGVGKTSISRIFAKALNCAEGPTPNPCLKCLNCQQITQGSSLAVREIDGASHNSVDNVRELIDSFRSLPPPGYKYKIYIIDEVHMLSISAFNALLKSLEEPPPNTVFILATTEAHKIPDTVISRCQRHEFRALSVEEIERRLLEIIKAEKIKIEADALRMVARLSDGSMRDAQSLLDRVQSFCEGEITATEASVALGGVERASLLALSQAVFDHQADQALVILKNCFAGGVDPAIFLKEFATHWRELLLAGFGGEKALAEIGVSEHDAKDLRSQIEKISKPDLQDLAQLAREGAEAALRSPYPKYALEALLVRLATRESVYDLQAVILQLKSIVSAGGVSSPVGAAGLSSKNNTNSNLAGTALVGTVVNTEVNTAERAPGTGVVGSSLKSKPQAPVAIVGGAIGNAALATEAPIEATKILLLSWADFVAGLADKGGKIFLEHLKRLVLGDFSAGRLRGTGPEFTIGYLNHKDNKAKLAQELKAYSGIESWEIDLQVAKAGMEVSGTSLQQQAEAADQQIKAQKREQISNHPKIKSLQKAFPGSTIENIQIK